MREKEKGKSVERKSECNGKEKERRVGDTGKGDREEDEGALKEIEENLSEENISPLSPLPYPTLITTLIFSLFKDKSSLSPQLPESFEIDPMWRGNF